MNANAHFTSGQTTARRARKSVHQIVIGAILSAALVGDPASAVFVVSEGAIARERERQQEEKRLQLEKEKFQFEQKMRQRAMQINLCNEIYENNNENRIACLKDVLDGLSDR